MERYKSFEELLTGNILEEPDWYQQGVAYLQSKQLPEGGWNSRSGKACSTSFSVLFLLRSTQKSIKANMGQGTLIGGRGLSANLTRMKMRRGRLVTEEQPTEIDQLLGMLDGDTSDGLEALVNDPTALQVNNVGPEQARRLQQLVKSGAPAGRILAVRALSKMRNLGLRPHVDLCTDRPRPACRPRSTRRPPFCQPTLQRIRSPRQIFLRTIVIQPSTNGRPGTTESAQVPPPLP